MPPPEIVTATGRPRALATAATGWPAGTRWNLTGSNSSPVELCGMPCGLQRIEVVIPLSVSITGDSGFLKDSLGFHRIPFEFLAITLDSFLQGFHAIP